MQTTTSAALPLTALALSTWVSLGATPAPSTESDRTIDLEVVVESDAGTLFSLFATSEGVRSLFPGAGARIGNAVGDEYRVAFDPAHPEGDLNGTAGCRILALEPPGYIAFQWRGPTWAAGMNVEPLPTWVEVDLSPAGSEATRVRLRHHGFAAPDGAEWDRSYAFFTKGWGSMLRRLQARYASDLQVTTAGPGSSR